MSQLITLTWLKWTLFRNSLRTSKAVVNRIASILAMAAALAFALVMSLGLGAAAYAVSSPELLSSMQAGTSRGDPDMPSVEFIFFSIFILSFLLWATLPLSIGASRQFDPGNLLLYPISFRKLFAIDFVSEVASLQSIFAIPAFIAIGIGVGLARGQMLRALLATSVAAAFGVALAKWVSTSVGALIRKRRTRGETLLAMIGAVAGLGGVFFAQISPVAFRNTESLSALRWTPPGAIAFALTDGLLPEHKLGYVLALAGLSAYIVALTLVTYALSHRAILGGGSKKRRRATPSRVLTNDVYTGWEIPFISPDLAAVIEKELRYSMRNAQLRMMALMPLILIGLRLINRRGFGEQMEPGRSTLITDLLKYGEGLIASGGLLYVFLILTGLSCNLFAFEAAGMRTLVLSPVNRKSILVGKNVSVAVVALMFSAALLLISHLVFRDITINVLLFAGLSFLIYAPLMSVIGNWLSIRFPKRMKFGTRMNVSGVVGLLLIPMMAVLAVPPLAAVAAGFVAQSLLVEYVTLALLAGLSLGLYLLIINAQGESLQARELEILEVVTEVGSD